MQVQNVNIGKGIHQGMAHAEEGGVVQIGVIGNKA
jgi:hypothetical protein